jgi:hypothetical protein
MNTLAYKRHAIRFEGEPIIDALDECILCDFRIDTHRVKQYRSSGVIDFSVEHYERHIELNADGLARDFSLNSISGQHLTSR